MKIWLINHYAIPPSEVGGTRHYTLARELIKRGHEVEIIASSYDHFARRDTRLAAGETHRHDNIDGVNFLWLATPPYIGNLARMWNMVMFAYRVYTLVRRAGLSRPDVVLGSSPHPFAALAAERIARQLGVPFVLEVRDLWPQSLIEVSKVSAGHPLIRVMEAIEGHLYRSADHILTLLPGAATHMTSRGAHSERITWLPNGVDLSMASEVAPLASGTPFTIMYAGSHGIANGLDSILDAAAVLEKDGWGDRVVFRLVGQGPEKERLQARVAREGLKMVRFEDPVPKEQIYKVMTGAHAFIVTMRNLELYRHGISLNKIYDYLAMGRPVVFGTNAHNNPIADAGAGISVPPEDAVAMANAIKSLVAMPESERVEMGLSGRRYVENHFSFERLTERLEWVFTNLTGRQLVVPKAVKTQIPFAPLPSNSSPTPTDSRS